MTVGSILHEVLEIYMQKIKGKAQDPGLIKKTLEEILNKQIAETGEIAPIFLQKLENDLFNMTDNLLKHEESCMTDGRGARFFELSFGIPWKENYQEDPVDLKVGKHSFKLRGSIDRVDASDNTVYILDYKGAKPDNYKNLDFDGGRKLQPALYSEALSSLQINGLQTTDIRAGYLPLKENSKEYLLHYDQANRNKLERIIDFIIRAMSKGFFFASGDCHWCNYQPICGKGIVAAAEKKRETATKKGPLKDLLNQLNSFEGY